jgi:hypothetical protein
VRQNPKTESGESNLVLNGKAQKNEAENELIQCYTKKSQECKYILAGATEKSRARASHLFDLLLQQAKDFTCSNHFLHDIHAPVWI